jgi:hypothetical protein
MQRLLARARTDLRETHPQLFVCASESRGAAERTRTLFLCWSAKPLLTRAH